MENVKEFGKGVLRVGAGILLIALGIDILAGITAPTSAAVSSIIANPAYPAL